MPMTPRERRLQQMAQKGYLALSPLERGEHFRQGIEGLKYLLSNGDNESTKPASKEAIKEDNE